MTESASDDPANDLDPAEPTQESAELDGRRYPSTIGGAFYLVVLAVVAIAIGVVASGNWRTGVRWFGSALVFAAVVRAVLPAKDAGMLAVRRRWWDCVLLAGTGAALIFLAASIPDQPL
ncbi:DUF3017 domain-containing protein [Nocardioides sp. MAH-18]|uniref:DUF3017 domain-containing protein n=1 Tax=Nocardioides agri TaxID=2682843 RepID=A0A6L6XPY9_9ACTN|nr:DUF3017 domain-containing protein [Nocardioides sp. CGMCC 1.13656]MBA2953999.1 DUF3017 domain-containing protein [Nocardioides sp. CGMCC 1.13656]MVQ48862.1 DUF3017 domain-containing protein [Nocardioides sp. MAH-18]